VQGALASAAIGKVSQGYIALDPWKVWQQTSTSLFVVVTKPEAKAMANMFDPICWDQGKYNLSNVSTTIFQVRYNLSNVNTTI